MGQDITVVSITTQDTIRLEVICLDSDKDEALSFCRDLRLRINQTTIKGMKSHLDS